MIYLKILGLILNILCTIIAFFEHNIFAAQGWACSVVYALICINLERK